MIDIESELFDIITNTIHSYTRDGNQPFLNAFITSTYVDKLPTFPTVMMEETDNYEYENGIDSSRIEKYANVVFTFNVYTSGLKKKSDGKELMNIIDSKMKEIGFTRNFSEPMSIDNPNLYRYTARYTGVVSKSKTIYRR